MKQGPRPSENLALGGAFSTRDKQPEGRDAMPAELAKIPWLARTVYPRQLPSFFAAGFECSTFIRPSGQRLDLVDCTRHDFFARLDYERLGTVGIRVARDGVRWHLVEREPGKYDFSSVLPVIRAAHETGTLVIWDLCHFGWPDDLDLFSSEFVTRLAAYGAAFAELLAAETGSPGFYVPVNEISFFSWSAGDEGSMFPFAKGRGFELKQHLVRAAVKTMDAIWEVQPGARFMHVDPVINVVADPKHPEDAEAAEAYRMSQYQAWDMISGRVCADLGGSPRHLDIIGTNYYPHNQWFYNLRGNRRIRKFRPVTRQNPLYRPFADILGEVFQRYERPVFVAETGAEDGRRRSWFRYVCEQAQAAMSNGIDLQGICLYPILNHPGWEDDRHCQDALWDYPDDNGDREIYVPLAQELTKWRKRFEVQPQNVNGSAQKQSRQAGDTTKDDVLNLSIAPKANQDMRSAN